MVGKEDYKALTRLSARRKARRRKASRRYYLKNRDKIRAQAKVYYHLHKDEYKKRGSEYYRKNSERCSQYNREYHIRNRERLLAYKRNYNITHKEQLYAKTKEKRMANRDRYLEQMRNYARLNRLISKGKSIYVRKRPYPNICEICGRYKPMRLAYHHWDDSHPEQGLWLCRMCHIGAEFYEKGLISRYLTFKKEVEVCHPIIP